MPTIDTIPPKSGEVCRALITVAVPSGRWYSRHGSEDIGAISADSDLAIRSGDLIISRIWHAGDTVFRLNRSGAGSLAAWVWGAGNVRSNGEFRPGDATNAALGPGHAKSIFIAFGEDAEVEILLLSLIASSGTGWINLELSAAQNALLDTIGGDFEVNFVIGDTAGAPPEPATLDTAGDVEAGAPGVSADAEVVPAAVRDTAAAIATGAPTLTATAEVVSADPATVHDTGGDVAAGAPTLAAQAEVVPAGGRDTAATAATGAPAVTAQAEVVPVGAPIDVGGDLATGAPELHATAVVVPVPSATNLQTCRMLAGAWMPRRARVAVMPILATVEGPAEDLVRAICREICSQLPYYVYGESCIPADAAPTGTLGPSAGEHTPGAIVVSLDPNQSEPEFSGAGGWEPSVSEVRLLVSQATTTDLEDLELFISRRADLRRVLSRLHGGIGV